jgi:hypothetical protein
MAWFCNRYLCSECGGVWEDEWSCMCDDDCPHCDARHMEPCDSIDLTEVIESRDDAFVVLRSPASAEDKPAYRVVVELPTREAAEAFLKRGII